MNRIVIISCALFVNLAWAETKELHCTYGGVEERQKIIDETPLKIKKHQEKIAELNKEHRVNNSEVETYEMLIELNRQIIKSCKNDNVWVSSDTFVFDTEGLRNESKAIGEHTSMDTCESRELLPRKVFLSATPSTISFKWAVSTGDYSINQSFNIDRKTLNGGYDTKRNYQCVVKEIDVSNNLI